MIARPPVWAWLAALAVLTVPAAATAQDPPPPPPQEERPTVGLDYQREIFTYPTLQRRNPFVALQGTDEGGPRFEQLRVMGIIHSDDPSASIAILGTSEVTLSADGSQAQVSADGVAWYLRQGQSIGNIRIVEIHPEQVVVEIEEFGLTDQRIMQLATRRPGGSP